MLSQESDLEFTLLIPCLNEAETIAVCVRKASSALCRLGIEGEVLVADNGSTDGSQELAISVGARVVAVHEHGYGAALIAGIKAARGCYVIMGDADDSYDWSAIDPFIETLRAGNQIVAGCRLPLGGGKVKDGAMPWLHRWVGNPLFSYLGRLFFRSQVTDIYCGMRGFSRAAVEQLQLTSHGMEFACEMIVKAALTGLSIAEVPITLHPDGRTKKPHLRTFRDGWRTLRFMLLYSPRWLFLWPGLTMLLIGAIGFILLLPGPVIVRGISFELNTMMVFSLLCLIGTQTLIFGLFARIFAARLGLLPPDFFLSRIYRRVRLEHGLFVGAIASVTGFVLLLVAVGNWAQQSFGALQSPLEPRLVITSLTLISLGIQIIFSSFFVSMLELPKGERR
ncbi:MAG: glycosyltransferase family 2 protein [Desulfomonilaceae bacterium]